MEPYTKTPSAKTPPALSPLILPAGVLVFNLLIILFPRETIAAAQEGLLLWFNNVLPSLLPFVAGANLLMGLGAAHFLAVLLEPFMQTVFGVSGSGGFAMAVGIMSGYPVGAKVTAELREKGTLTQSEAQRMASLASNAGPLFIIGAVANGMFKSTAAGWFLLTAHYGGAILAGLLFRFLSPRATHRAAMPARHILPSAIKSMAEARRKDGRPFGSILKQSVADTMETLLHVGGYIVLFGVIVKALELLGVPAAIESAAFPLTSRLGLSHGLLSGLFTGALEMTNGARQTAVFGTTKEGLLAAAAVISWGGLSVHAQALGFVSRTDIKAAPYLVSKLIHAGMAVLFGFLMFPFFETALAESVPAMATLSDKPLWTLARAAGLWGLTVLVPAACAVLWGMGQRIWRGKIILRKLFAKRKGYGTMTK